MIDRMDHILSVVPHGIASGTVPEVPCTPHDLLQHYILSSLTSSLNVLQDDQQYKSGRHQLQYITNTNERLQHILHLLQGSLVHLRYQLLDHPIIPCPTPRAHLHEILNFCNTYRNGSLGLTYIIVLKSGRALDSITRTASGS